MARVPDTNTFALTDVKTAVTVVSQGSVTSVTNNGGTAKFNVVGSTSDLAIGDWITLNSFTYYSGTHQVTAITAHTWFECGVTYTNADSGSWIRYMKSLIDLFDEAADPKFDPLYDTIPASKDRQSNFRNYGWSGVPTLVETEDQGSSYTGVHGATFSGTGWIMVAYASGIISYIIDKDGYMTQKGTSNQTATQKHIHHDPTYRFVFSTDDSKYVSSWSYNTTTGNLTRVTYLDTRTAYGAAQDKDPSDLCSDGSKFIFIINDTPITNYFDIMILEFNTSTGALTYKNYYRGALNETFWEIIYSNGYLFTTGSAGVRSFTVNQSTGALTPVDSGEGSTYSPTTLWSDDNGNLFCASYSYGLLLFTHSSGAVTYRTYNDDAPGSPPLRRGAFGDKNNRFIYVLEDTGDKICVYRLGANNTLDYEGQTSSGYVYGWSLFCPINTYNQVKSLFVLTRGNNGISSFKLE